MLITCVLVICGAVLVSANAPVETTIDKYREIASLARSTSPFLFIHSCSGTILNNRSVLTSARCVEQDEPERCRVRVGSTTWNSGGVVYYVSLIISHQEYDPWKMTSDLAIMRIGGSFVFGTNSVQAGRYSGSSYSLLDNQPVTIAGWGYLSFPLHQEVQYTRLYEIKQRTVNLDNCRQFYITEGLSVLSSSLCTFSRSDNTRDKCLGEPGSPVYHRGTIVGVRSYALGCAALEDTPTISTRVSSFINWISDNA